MILSNRLTKFALCDTNIHGIDFFKRLSIILVSDKESSCFVEFTANISFIF
ncbi:hypothetical protein GCM10008908_01300 [Clostridium subterminale]|uniref:Uncharacterized protein n=1 Tax=Clostridium subterminale TaxID=1550 RepID=A0ABP3VQP4_CLOSU